MILRRIAQHLRKQEWTAIGIDFLIVVVGVFVATQVTDWNNARLAQDEYRRALERVDAEISANIIVIDENLPHLEETLTTANHALDVLQSCEDSPANREAINAGLREIRGTSGLRLRTRALREIVTSPALLAQQTDAEREHFSALLDYMDLSAEEMRFYELHPLAQRVEDNALLRVGAPESATYNYQGMDYTTMRRPLTLNTSIAQACRNTQLIAAFFTWTRWQGNIPTFARQMRQELETTQTFLTEQL